MKEKWNFEETKKKLFFFVLMGDIPPLFFINFNVFITSIHQFFVDTRCRLEDLPRVITYKKRWEEIIKGICAVGMS